MARHPYIAIEGVIGVGKTTLVRLLQPAFGGEAALEEFDENPFLSDFYADRERYGFQTQIFFLLSRYRQQTTRLPAALRHGAVLADYTFAKDSLFAHLNLKGAELAVYERVYAALGANIRRPDLLVYLRADTDVLMARIAARDRTYERNMDRDYIDGLRLGYEQFLSTYNESPLLVVDTNQLNLVQNADDLASVTNQVKSSLKQGSYQAALPGVNGDGTALATEQMVKQLGEGLHTLADFQDFHQTLDAEKGFDPDPFLNFIGLSEEMGELARILKQTWLRQADLHDEGSSLGDAQTTALNENRERIQNELADCLAFLLKLSNYAGIDLEEAYLQKMEVNARRKWENGRAVEKTNGSSD